MNGPTAAETKFNFLLFIKNIVDFTDKKILNEDCGLMTLLLLRCAAHNSVLALDV